MHGLGEKESVIGHLAVSSGSSIEVLHSSSSAQLHRCTVSNFAGNIKRIFPEL